MQNGEEFQVIVIGGTYSVFALCKKEHETCKILSSEGISVPLFTSKDIFLEFLKPKILPTTKTLALNFAYPLTPIFRDGMLDGTLLRGTKGHTFDGLTEKTIGWEIEKYMNQDLKVTVANDTVCLLLSGLEKNKAQNLGAGIVGSGMNFAFFKDSNTAINLESADFNKFEYSKTGKKIDQESVNPTHSLYEKEVSGVYLFKHYNLLNKDKQISDTSELNRLAKNNDALAKELLCRSASLIACQVAALMDFKSSSMTFIMEGSVFWKGFEYKKTVEEVSSQLSAFKAEFLHIPDSNVIGTAHLVI